MILKALPSVISFSMATFLYRLGLIGVQEMIDRKRE
jgi:hypothetical protein